MTMRPYLLFSLCSVLFPVAGSTLNAQSSEAESSSVIFRTFAWGDSMEEVFFDSRPVQPEPVLIQKNFRSPFYSYTGPSPMVFYRQETAEDGSILRIPVASINLPKDAGQLMVFFIVDPETGALSRAKAVDDSLEAFPIGSIRVINFAEKPFGLRLGEQKLVTRPGELKTVPVKASESNTVGVLAAAESDGVMQIVYSTTWGLRANDRLLVFLLPRGDSVSVRKFPESEFSLNHQRARLEKRTEAP